MLARGMNHVSFPVRDLAASLAFYRDVLGLAELPRPDLGVPGAWLRAGDAEVHLLARIDGLPLGEPPGGLTPAAAHVAFTVDDYADTLAVLQARGLPVFETSPAQGQMWVQDPDGHVIELIVRGAR